MKIVFTGLESSGKSLLLAKQAQSVLRRNARWLKTRKKLGLDPNPRTMAFNTPMSPEFIKKIEAAGLVYLEWRDFNQIERLVDADIFIDELLKIFPARGTEPLLPHQMDFLTQGAKSGVHIFASSQDFSQVHKQFRLLTNKVYVVRKIIGSPRPMKSAPPVAQIWGLCTKRGVDPASFQGDNTTLEAKGLLLPFLIRKKDAECYDTLYKVPRAELPDLKLRRQRVYAEDAQGKLLFEKYQFR